MQVRLLGPVDVMVDDVSRPVRGLRPKALLAVLALRSAEIVSTDSLIDIVWGATAPVTAVNTVQSHVSYLRQVLGSKPAIRARPPGYVLDLGGEGTDVEAAERLVRLGAQAASSADRARHLHAALRLWRGRPLADVAGVMWLEEQAERLDGLWLRAKRALTEAQLDLGEHAQLVPDLEGLIRDHPLDEQIRGQLILALYRAGRQADALAAYHRLRCTLRDDLGIDPSQPLRDLETAILRQDPALDPPAPPGPAVTLPSAPAVVSVPAQLPPVAPAFTGRERELARLDAMLAAAGREPTAVAIATVSGTAGVGKTALAVHWAHRVATQFPDGQLYVNLRGYDPDQPVTPASALAGFLGGLGVASQDIPLDLDERAARYRTEISGRRMLVVLDNASSLEQVHALLPGTPTAMVVVTSRDSMAGLVVRHGARRLELHLMPAADAVALLRELIGSRVDAEPEAAATLAGQCARLPLALRVAAELAAARPASSLRELTGELADQQRRLDLLDAGGDPRVAVTAVLSWSYRHLPPDAARVFRLAGLHPGPDADAYAAAAMAGTNLDQTRRLVDVLVRAHLIHPNGPGRYRLHDLLYAYAASLAAADDDPADEPRRVMRRLLDYYIGTAASAIDQMYPADKHLRPGIPPPVTPAPSLADSDAARAWLDAERPALIEIAAYAASHGWPAYAVRLGATLHRYLAGGHHGDAMILHTHSRDAARQSGDRHGEAHALHCIGTVHARLGRYDQAASHFEQALLLCDQVGNLDGQARALNNLGTIDLRLGRYAVASDRYRQALALYRQAGNQVGQGHALDSLGDLERRLGRYPQAADYHQQAVALHRQAGNRDGEAWALTSLGDACARLGLPDQAADHLQDALVIFNQAGSRVGQAWALTGLGDLSARLGLLGEASAHHQQSLVIFREIGDQDGQPWALNGLGEAALAAGQPAEALTHYAAALAITDRTGVREQEARAHAGLGHAYHALGDPATAGQHAQQALAIYAELDIPVPTATVAH